jgi:hypothetical protein
MGQDTKVPSPTFANLIFLGQYRLFVCSECQEATTYGQLSTHLSKVHRYDTTSRNDALAWALTLVEEPVIEKRVGFQIIPVPDDTIDPIEGLGPVHTDGYRCTYGESNCPFVGATERRIREHLIHSHGWQPPRSRAGRPSRHGNRQSTQQTAATPWRTGVYYQRFARRGAYSKWFEVSRNRPLDHAAEAETRTSVSASAASSIATGTSSALESRLEAEERYIQDEKYKLERFHSLPQRFGDVWYL